MSGTKAPRYGNSVHPMKVAVPIAAGSAKIYAGNDVGIIGSSGYGAIWTATGVSYIIGKAMVDLDQSAATTTAYLEVECGAFFYTNASSTDACGRTDVFKPVFSTSLGKASKTDSSGASPFLGYMLPGGGSDNLGTGPDNGKVLVLVGQQSPFSTSPLAANELTARFAFTSLAAFAQASGVITGSVNGAMGSTQDGQTPAVGDVAFLIKGSCGAATVAAADAGPWVITSLGGASSKYTMARPYWFANGALIKQGLTVKVQIGTLFGGVDFRSFAATAALVIGTGDPAFWPGSVRKAVTFSSGTVSAITTIPIRSLSYTTFKISSDPTTAPHASTRVWRVNAATAGDVGTASFVPAAESAPGTTNASDVGQYVLEVSNWT
jgi:hypothetical protein